MSRASALNISQLNAIARSTASRLRAGIRGQSGGGYSGVRSCFLQRCPRCRTSMRRRRVLPGVRSCFLQQCPRGRTSRSGYARPLRHLASFRQRQHLLVDISEIGTQAKCGLGSRACACSVRAGVSRQIELCERSNADAWPQRGATGSIDLDPPRRRRVAAPRSGARSHARDGSVRTDR